MELNYQESQRTCFTNMCAGHATIGKRERGPLVLPSFSEVKSCKGLCLLVTTPLLMLNFLLSVSLIFLDPHRPDSPVVGQLILAKSFPQPLRRSCPSSPCPVETVSFQACMTWRPGLPKPFRIFSVQSFLFFFFFFFFFFRRTGSKTTPKDGNIWQTVVKYLCVSVNWLGKLTDMATCVAISRAITHGNLSFQTLQNGRPWFSNASLRLLLQVYSLSASVV